MEAMCRRFSFTPFLLLAAVLAPPAIARAFDVVLNAQGEFLDAYLVNGSPFPPRLVFIDPDPPDPDDLHSRPRVGRHVNGKLCFFPRGFGHDGQFVIADDTYREACLDRRAGPQARCSVTHRGSPLYVGKDPDGWGIFRANGKWTKRTIHAEWDFSAPEEPQGNIDPQGCAFDSKGNFWATDVGHGSPGLADGSLIVFFPGKRKRYDTYCFVDKALGAPGMPVMDAAGNLYIPEPSLGRVTKFSPPFPSSPADCSNPERLVTTPPTRTRFTLGASGLAIPAGIAQIPGTDHFYIGGVILPPVINEYDRDLLFVRTIVPAGVPKNPLGIDVGSDGTVYYAELNLDPATFDTRCGSVSQVRFDANGQPLPPETLGKDLRFPDGVTVVDASRLRVNFRKLPAAPQLDPSRCGGE